MIELIVVQNFFKMVMRDAHHNIGIHLDKPTIAIPCKTRILGRSGKRLDRVIIKTQI